MKPLKCLIRAQRVTKLNWLQKDTPDPLSPQQLLTIPIFNRPPLVSAQRTMRSAALLLLGLHCAAAVGSHEHRAQFKAWLQKFADEYRGKDVEKLFNVWMQNKQVVDTINAEQQSWVAELGRFAGYTQEEFVDKVLISEAAPVKRSGKTLRPQSAADGESCFWPPFNWICAYCFQFFVSVSWVCSAC